MAILLNGIFGGLSGRIGNLVFRNLRGVTVVSRRPIRRNKNYSRAQLEQRAKFSKICRLLRPLVPLLKRTYRLQAKGMSSFNKAFSDNIRNAISGEYPNCQINWAALQLSRGNLPAVVAGLVEGRKEGTVEFRWSSSCGTGTASADDRVWVAVYCEELDVWEFKTNGAVRTEGRWSLNVRAFQGRLVRAYAGFISADEKWITQSSYAGSLKIA